MTKRDLIKDIKLSEKIFLHKTYINLIHFKVVRYTKSLTKALYKLLVEFSQKPLILESINLSRDLSRDMSAEEFSKSFNPQRFNMDFNNYNFTNLFKNDEYDIYSK